MTAASPDRLRGDLVELLRCATDVREFSREAHALDDRIVILSHQADKTLERAGRPRFRQTRRRCT